MILGVLMGKVGKSMQVIATNKKVIPNILQFQQLRMGEGSKLRKAFLLR
jgi:hypothetical protein